MRRKVESNISLTKLKVESNVSLTKLGVCVMRILEKIRKYCHFGGKNIEIIICFSSLLL